MYRKLKKNIFITIGFAAILYLGFIVFGEFDSLLKTFLKFNWIYLPLLLVLSFLNYFTRFLKWEYYLNILKVRLDKKDSFSIFMSGLLMSVTPGKMGELLKSYLLKQLKGTPISRSAPIVFAERLTDFLALILLAALGSAVFNFGKTFLIVSGIVFIGLILLLSSRNLFTRILKFLEKIKFLGKYLSNIKIAYESSYQLIRPVRLFKMTLISITAWFFECLGFYIILINFGVRIDLMLPTFIYSFSTIAGAITMLPGGLGATEGSLTYLLIQNGITKDIAISSTFLIRIVTLWFAIFVGAVSVIIYQKRFGRIINDE